MRVNAHNIKLHKLRKRLLKLKVPSFEVPALSATPSKWKHKNGFLTPNSLEVEDIGNSKRFVDLEQAPESVEQTKRVPTTEEVPTKPTVPHIEKKN
ncbi:hypothetical protein J1N35_018815 [Gossypium stocksii]|uniref:Uncharacterized protein n=1 Tax=Gossypium stocksii TaxID=47602 RepID=A0A9D3VRD1_9ROSI|nr:hypothetical protein J1N35_018815 [Gossypium stocksii]